MSKSAFVRGLFAGIPGWCALCAALWAACGQTAAQAQGLRAQAGEYELQVLVDGQTAASFAHAGEDYVLGRLGARYTLRIVNHSGRRIEAVVSVDGLDVIDGKKADFRSKRGYLVPAWGSIEIDGWRLSVHQAAVFRFSAVADSYAGRTGSTRNVGVIGAAIFPERYAAPPVQIPIRPHRERSDAEPRARREAPASSRELESKSSAAMNAPPVAESLDSGQDRAASAAAPHKQRSGLGTEFGEAVSSRITEVEFVRAHQSAPARLLGLRYDDRDGLIAMGVVVEPRCDATCREIELRRSASPFPVSYRRYAAPPAGWR